MIALHRLPLFTIMTGVSLAIGLLVPTMVEFGENPTARSRHGEMEFAALLSVLIALIIAVILWFWNRSDQAPHLTRRLILSQQIEFSLGSSTS